MRKLALIVFLALAVSAPGRSAANVPSLMCCDPSGGCVACMTGQVCAKNCDPETQECTEAAICTEPSFGCGSDEP